MYSSLLIGLERTQKFIKKKINYMPASNVMRAHYSTGICNTVNV